jgi:23S rRNA (uridine2479-2'-O)-methyltransferase
MTNPRIKQIRAIAADRKDRRKAGLFFAEGVHALNAAYRNGWTIHTLLYAPDAIKSQWAREIVERTPVDARLEVSVTLRDQLSDRESPSELMALIAQRGDDFDRIHLHDRLLVLLLDTPRSPGNLGSAIRSADALGAQGVIITGHAADLYDPKTVRASMGSLFEVPVVRVAEHQQLEDWLAAARAQLGRVQLVATSAHAKQQLFALDLTGPTIIAIGTEETGISNYIESMADAFVSIPMFGSASSLNASVAASICLYEVARQRLSQPTDGTAGPT